VKLRPDNIEVLGIASPSERVKLLRGGAAFVSKSFTPKAIRVMGQR